MIISFAAVVFTWTNFASLCMSIACLFMIDKIFDREITNQRIAFNLIIAIAFWLGFGFYNTIQANDALDYCQVHIEQGYHMMGNQCMLRTPVGDVPYNYKGQ